MMFNIFKLLFKLQQWYLSTRNKRWCSSTRHRRSQWLKYLGFDFWLPLPILGLCFWLVANMATGYLFTRSSRIVVQPQVIRNKISEVPDRNIFFIQVKIDRELGSCEVYVEKKTETVKRSRFKLPTIDPLEINFAISKKLDIPLEKLNQKSFYWYE